MKKCLYVAWAVLWRVLFVGATLYGVVKALDWVARHHR